MSLSHHLRVAAGRRGAVSPAGRPCRLGRLPVAGLLALVALAPFAAGAAEPQWRGYIEAEATRYPQSSANPDALRNEQAIKFRPELLWHAGDGLSVGARAFVREDGRNPERDAARFDELWLQYATSGWDLRVGEQVVTWGSVESFSPLDVVNPRDNHEDVIEPAKIGVPAARLRLRAEDDDFSLYWLPVYEPTRYPGVRSYYGSTGTVPVTGPSGGWQGDQYAARWFHSGDGYDIGLSWFDGIDRAPVYAYSPGLGAMVGSTRRARRLGFEATRVIDELLLKSEVVYRTTDEEGARRAGLWVFGAEYTLTSVWEHADLTGFLEWLGATRNVRERELMQNDLFIALRLTFNDRLKQRLQVGSFRDLDHGGARLDRIEYTASPVPNVEAGLRRTAERDYFPGVAHREADTGVWHVFLRYNF